MLLKLCVITVVVMLIKGSLSIHKIRFYCQVYNMETKPYFEEWMINQDYDNMLYEYKYSLEYVLPKRKANTHSSKHINLTITYILIVLFYLAG